MIDVEITDNEVLIKKLSQKVLENKIRLIVIQELFRLALAVIIGFMSVKFLEWLFFSGAL